MDNTLELARKIKAHIVSLAVADKLPMDITKLNVGAIDKIIKKHVRGNAREEKKQAILERASAYLCNDDIEAAITAIARNDDQNEDIDLIYIDNNSQVEVYQKVQMQFTCKEFLSAIGYDNKLF